MAGSAISPASPICVLPRADGLRMSRILVAVSSPWAAQKAVDPVSNLAKRLGAEVLVIHVSRPSGGQMGEEEQADGGQAISTLKRSLEEGGLVGQKLVM